MKLTCLINILKSFSLIIILFASFSNIIKADEYLNLYSARQEVLLKPLINKFEKEHNIKINIIAAKASQLINRLEQEGKYTKADVLLTVDVARLINAKKKGLFKPTINSKLMSSIPLEFRDKENYWFGLSLRARIIVFNKNTVKNNELSGYYDLANKKWRNRIFVRSSNNVYNQSLIAAMLLNYGEKETSVFLKNFVSNFARTPSGGDRDQIRAIVSGLGDLALVNSYYFLNMKNNDEKKLLKNLDVHFPEDGKMQTHVNISGAGIIKYTINSKNAEKFLEFMISDEAQKIYSDMNYEYPIRRSIKLTKFMQKYKVPAQDSLNLTEIGKVNKKAMLLMDKAGWQ